MAADDLLQDLDAVPVLVHHALQAPDLALDPAQTLLDALLVLDVARSHGPPIVPPIYPHRVYVDRARLVPRPRRRPGISRPSRHEGAEVPAVLLGARRLAPGDVDDDGFTVATSSARMVRRRRTTRAVHEGSARAGGHEAPRRLGVRLEGSPPVRVRLAPRSGRWGVGAESSDGRRPGHGDQPPRIPSPSSRSPLARASAKLLQPAASPRSPSRPPSAVGMAGNE